MGYKILAVCAGGFSSSLLVNKMKDAVKTHGLDVTIWATGSNLPEEDWRAADIILLAPQIRYMKANMLKQINNQRVILDIAFQDYGHLNGEKLVMDAIAYLQTHAETE